MTNSLMVQKTFDWLLSEGVEDICLCPGGRNAPFAVALAEQKTFHVHTSFDERSAGFFALGLSQKKQKPVAVIVTSGTAVAELFPAVMESHYTQTPLVILSADRPRRLRGTGAPQTVDQVGLFGNYVEKCVDVEGEFSEIRWSQLSSLHLNICFDEPLIDGSVKWTSTTTSAPKVIQRPLLKWNGRKMILATPQELASSWQDFSKVSQRALVLVSTLASGAERESVREWLKKWPGWVYAEGPSGLREMEHEGRIVAGDRRVQQMLMQGEIDSVIRLGGVPTARAWRNLDRLQIPVFSLSSLPFPGMERGAFFSGTLAELLKDLEPPPFIKEGFSEAQAKDLQIYQTWSELLQKYPLSEPAMVAQISQIIADDSSVGRIYLGNSLPIREWDGFAGRKKNMVIQANRGANGIDGQLSTALAFMEPQKSLWVILGDLTTLYDSNALWFWQKRKHPLKLVVINNSGGKIFERLFNKNIFYNDHNLQFKFWAEQWGIPYVKQQEKRLPLTDLAESCVIELVPTESQTKAFWQDYDRLWES